MDTSEAIFLAAGESPGVLALADCGVDGVVQQRIAIGERNPATGKIATTNSVIIKLPLSDSDDAAATCDIKRWLTKHRATIQLIDAQKTLEFYTFLASDMGSRTFTIPNSLVGICAELGLDVAIQSIRTLSESELTDLRGKGQ